ncbi:MULTISPECIES: hypothetical protein [Pseudomonas syringae group]|nr:MULTISPECIES: hypothetical protein [Pseudomonas syringae group]POC98035.1 hypothetical protein BKM22_27975 [Pseudomonas amygdali pv. morsprunorum]POD36326.1 hypothetical protein BKM16_28005 [Pseudomonas amygdali pv. morsprunorum]POD41390.1 hypothetical protein BKM02_24885 [Pseudomonas amygdali pv. morsprunorum]SOQ16390.1 hypothetical protein CFBP1573P_06076 [Pseudomonas syringae pv. persicae]
MANDTVPFLFDDCRQGGATEADSRIQQIRNNRAEAATAWPHMAALAALVAESHGIQPSSRNNAPERNAFSYSNVSPLITRINRFVEDPMFQAVVDVEGGVSRNPGKFRRKTSPERFTAAFAIRHGFPYMFWPLNQTVFGLATSQPENKCLASIRTITGFPPMTEISGVPAYNPAQHATERILFWNLINGYATKVRVTQDLVKIKIKYYWSELC